MHTRNYDLIDRIKQIEVESREAFRTRTRCKRGHAKTDSNVIRRSDGALECRVCRQMRKSTASAAK